MSTFDVAAAAVAVDDVVSYLVNDSWSFDLCSPLSTIDSNLFKETLN